VVVHDHNSVITLVGGLHRTDLSAWWILAVITQQGNRLLTGFGRVFFPDVHLSNPMHIPPLVAMKSNVVLSSASNHAFIAVLATFGEVNDHSPFVVGQNPLSVCLGLRATSQ
jgi:hypothetical protein